MFELDCEAFCYFGADGVAEGFDVGGGGVASVDQGQGVAGGDSGVALLEAFGEAGFSRSHAAGSLVWPSEAGQLGMVSAGMLRVAAMASRVAVRDDGVFEEGAGAAAVGFAVDEKHALAVTDGADSVVDVDGGGVWPAKWRVRSG